MLHCARRQRAARLFLGAPPGDHCVGIIMSHSHLRMNLVVVLTRGQRVLEYIRERRCAWCATFPIGKHIMMYETGNADTKSRLSA